MFDIHVTQDDVARALQAMCEVFPHDLIDVHEADNAIVIEWWWLRPFPLLVQTVDGPQMTTKWIICNTDDLGMTDLLIFEDAIVRVAEFIVGRRLDRFFDSLAPRESEVAP